MPGEILKTLGRRRGRADFHLREKVARQGRGLISRSENDYNNRVRPNPARCLRNGLMATDADIARAAAILRDGGLVAFPTETVYGLGANALDERAVARVFDVKARPRFDPLIVHIAGVDWLARLTAEFPPLARQLAEKFWPGPLTLVLPKTSEIGRAHV